MRLFRRAYTNERGAELLEFAFALPILLLVLAGIIDFVMICPGPAASSVRFLCWHALGTTWRAWQPAIGARWTG